MKKVVFITGASSGIGKETAQTLVKEGFKVYGASRRTEKMQSLAKSGIEILPLDLTKDGSINQVIDTILKKENRLDILINNAGYGSYGAFEDVPMEEARHQFEVNIFGLARLTQLVISHMRRQKAGRIINISSIGGSFGEPHGSWYHATKYALEGISDSLRMELKQFNIDVVIIKPGAIRSEWNGIARKQLMEVSGQTAYHELVQKHYRLLEKADKQASHSSVVAKTILKASKAKNPKTRYVVGSGARPLILIRKLLSDRLFDKIMLNAMK
ncbi:MAG: oxidoreductase [Bacteroidota bacterium]